MESYISNELPFLSKTFDAVHIIPYHEFSFNEKESRLKDFSYSNVSVFQSSELPRYSIFERIERSWDIAKLLMAELWHTNQRSITIKKIKTLFFRIKHYHAIAKKLAKLCASEKISLDTTFFCYHYWNHDGVVIEYLMNKRFQFRPKKSISRAHSIDLFHNDWPKGFVAFERLKIDHLHRIYAISEIGLNYLKKKFPKEQFKFHLAYLGVKDEYKGTVDFPVGKFTILTVSNIAEIKRLPLMVDIMKYLPKDLFQWVHIGDGIAQYANPLRNYAENSGIDFKFLGHYHQNQIHQFYQNHDILCFINLSYMEGVPVSIMESMMHGIPCIATQVGGTAELIQNNHNGYLIQPEIDIEGTANLILTLSQDPYLWKTFSKNCREVYLKKLNSNSNYHQFYQEMIEDIH